MKIVAFVILIMMGLASCEEEAKPDLDPSFCIPACQNIHDLGCEGYGAEDGGICVEVCESAIVEGEIDMHAGCMADAGSCEAVEGCFL